MRNKKSASFSIGLDLGGTKLAAGLVNAYGQLLETIKVPVEMSREGSATLTQKRVLSLMSDVVMDFEKRFPKECSTKYFSGVGLASAGPLNTETGDLIYPANFPGWKIYPIRSNLKNELVKRKFKTEVYFQNDAIAAALAEGWVGEAQNLETYVVVTVGTGIGSGVIVKRQPCQTHGMGSEFGHILVDINNLKNSNKKADYHSVEGFASGTGLLRRAQDLGFEGTSVESLIFSIENGETQFQVLLDDMALALAILCYNLSIGFRLEKILLSGGLLKIKKLFLPALRRHYDRLISEFNKEFKAPIQIAGGGVHAGIVGAAYLPYL